MNKLVKIGILIITFIGWIAYLVVCFTAELWSFLIVGIVFFPIGIVYGISIWSGWWQDECDQFDEKQLQEWAEYEKTQIKSLRKVIEEKTNRIHELGNQFDNMWKSNKTGENNGKNNES